MTEAPQNRREAAKARTIRRTQEVAEALFNEVGYEGATMRGIAKRMGMSTGAINANFAGKDALWEDVMKMPPPKDIALYRAAPDLLNEAIRACHDAKVRFIRMVRDDGFDVTTYAEAVEAHGAGSPYVEHLEGLIAKAETPLPFERVDAC